MKNIIIFGVNDIGSNIAYVLLKDTDYKLTLIDTLDPNRFWNRIEAGYMRRTQDNIAPRVSFIHTSEMDTESMLDELYNSNVDKYDAVILANAEHNSEYIRKNPNWSAYVNIDYPTKICDALRRLDKFKEDSRVIHMSHWSIYGDQEAKLLPYKETILPKPIGLRSSQLYSQETVVQGLCRAYGMSFVTLRLGTVVGPYTSSFNLMGTFVKNVILEETIMLDGLGDQSRDMVLAEDVGKVTAAVIGKPEIKNEVFNVGGNDSINISKNQVIDAEKTVKRIARSVNEFIKTMHQNPTIRIQTRNKHTDPEYNLRCILDNRKLKEKVGVIPESREADIIKKTAIYIGTYVLQLDPNKMDRLKVALNMMLPTSSSEDNIKMYEKRYNINREEKTYGKKEMTATKELPISER